MILIKEFSLASRFYLSQLKFASQNLRNTLQIAKCEALIRTLYFYGYKKVDKKDKLDCILYIWCRHFTNIVQQLGQKF